MRNLHDINKPRYGFESVKLSKFIKTSYTRCSTCNKTFYYIDQEEYIPVLMHTENGTHNLRYI